LLHYTTGNKLINNSFVHRIEAPIEVLQQHIIRQSMSCTLQHELLKPQPRFVDQLTFQAFETLDTILEYHHLWWREKSHLEHYEQLHPRSDGVSLQLTQLVTGLAYKRKWEQPKMHWFLWYVLKWEWTTDIYKVPDMLMGILMSQPPK